MTKSKLLKGGILTNLDLKTTPAEQAAHDRSEKRKAFVKEVYAKAERAERETGVQAPTMILGGLQRKDVFSQDPIFDKSREAVVGQKQLPVKQCEVTPEGEWAIWVGEAAKRALIERRFCHCCWDPQPDDPRVWKEVASSRAVRLHGTPPADFAHGVYCCYCGSRLGIENTGDDPKVELWRMTPEQRHLLETMFGPIRAENQ